MKVFKLCLAMFLTVYTLAATTCASNNLAVEHITSQGH